MISCGCVAALACCCLLPAPCWVLLTCLPCSAYNMYLVTQGHTHKPQPTNQMSKHSSQLSSPHTTCTCTGTTCTCVHVLPACCASACHSLLPFSIGYSDFPWIYLLHSPLLKVTGPSAVIHSFSQRHTDKRTGTVVLRSIAKRCSFLPRDVQLYDSVMHSSDCETHTHSHWATGTELNCAPSPAARITAQSSVLIAVVRVRTQIGCRH